METFQAAQADGEPEVIFWIDVVSIDQHKVGGWPQEWWTTNFKEAIGLIGHTVMMLSPWGSPVPLTRAWCLWELHCTVEVGAAFSVCLGPDEQAALEAALLDDCDALLNALAGIDVAEAQAGKESDRAMILAAVRATAGGTSDLNGRAMAQMRGWVRGVVAGMVAARREPAAADGSMRSAELGNVGQLAMVLYNLGELVEARRLYEEVLPGMTEQLGPAHTTTLGCKMCLAMVLREMGERGQARRLLEEALAGRTEQLGPAHIDTLDCKLDLAALLAQTGEHGEARRLYGEGLAGMTEQLGPTNIHTLRCKMNLAVLLKQMGERVEARGLYAEALAGYTEQLGPTHTDTLTFKMNLANLLSEMGDLGEAQRLYGEVLAGRTEQLGPTHTDTLRCKMNMAGPLAVMDLIGARRLLEEAAAGFEAQLGPAHPDTKMAAQKLALLSSNYFQMLGAPAPAPARPAADTTAAGTAVVVLKGLVGAAQHNGKRAAMLGFAADRGQLTVELEGAAASGAARQQLWVKPENVELASVPANLVVGVDGLIGAAQHNSKRGRVIGGPDSKTGRYTVLLEEGGQPLGLKLQNLRLLEAMEADQVARATAMSLQPAAEPGPGPGDRAAAGGAPSAAGAETGVEEEPHRHLAAADAFAGLGLAWPTGEAVESLASFLAGPPGSGAGLPLFSRDRPAPEYCAMLAGLGPAELSEAALVEAGVVKVFHRKRIARWAGSLVKIG
jgi:hypothetical protein